MFDIPVSPIEKGTFTILLAVWAFLIFGGFAWGKPTPKNPQRIPLPNRIAASFILTSAAWLWFAVTQGTLYSSFALWIAIGMVCGLIGDVFMADLLGLESHILYGMGSFGLGHVFYIIAMMMIAETLGLRDFPMLAVLGAWWVIACVGWFFAVWYRTEHNLLHKVALPYALLLASTAGFASSIALIDNRFTLLAIGAILFLISDLILASVLFAGKKIPLSGDLVWLTYSPAQMLITMGLIILTLFL